MGKVSQASHLIVLTGSGVSAESGINTFRGGDGLWENHRVEDVATPEAFRRDPDLVDNFYNERRHQLLSPEIKPNSAHMALAKLEELWVGNFLLVTQNVDDLHERAGSTNILHIHGELLKARDLNTGEILEWRDEMTREKTPHLRPHIVWFGEIPLFLDQIYEELESCDLLISIGTSGLVYPAAGFAKMAPQAHKIEINIQDTPISPIFDEHRIGPAGEQVPKLVESLLNPE